MDNITFYDIKKPPFEIFGLYKPLADEECFIRVPREVAKATSVRVEERNLFTAGGRVRFKTDSDVLVIRTKNRSAMTYHTTPAMRSGYDVYIDRPQGAICLGCTKPEPFSITEYEFTYNLGAGEKELTVNMPLYGNVRELFIGLRDGASISAHSPYKYNIPVVFYGSSITQGACASRPGRAYEAIISRKYDLNFTNLGFSCACRAEKAIVEYMAGLPMSAFVSDYDHNAPTVEHLKKTHHRLYEKIRENHPDIPYFMITKPDFRFEKDSLDRRAVVMESYLEAYNSGDKNVYFIDGSAFFNGTDISDLTLDRCHPNDEGFGRMAAYIGDVIAKVMDL
jgi:hypothetical protein